jgi:IS5 family transposase
VFQVMKLQFGFVKLRYRGLKKNAHRLFVTCALVNLFLGRRKLLRTATALTQAKPLFALRLVMAS